MTTATEHAVTKMPPCPEWCALPEGHAYDGHTYPATDWECARFHISGDKDAAVEVARGENVVNGVVTSGDVELNLWIDGDATPVTPAQARTIVALIPAVVDLYERLADAS